MVRTTLARSLLAAALVITSPVGAAAQDVDGSAEGVEWHLTTYAVEDESTAVPWHVDATLTLTDGTASGSTGCNTFSGSYTLDGSELTFDPAVSMTRMTCPDARSAVEDGYMANLAQVESWAVEEGELLLSDADGFALLGFEQATAALTASDVAAIAQVLADQQAEIERLDGRIDGVRIRVLRERVKTLEDQVKDLTSAQAAEQERAATTYDASERTLLQGIPKSIRATCKPLRSDKNPAGTLAAVRCKPKGDLIGELAYYLMPFKQARRTFNTVMDRNGVPQRDACYDGRPSRGLFVPLTGHGCFVDGGRANVRLIDWAAGCHQLTVGGTQVQQPAIYVAMEGKDRRIAPLFRSLIAEGGWRVTLPIPHGSQPLSPGCEP